MNCCESDILKFEQEVKQKLPIMLSTLRNFEDYEFVIAQSPTLEKSIYETIIGDKKIQLIQNKTYEILKIAKLALVTSGTATLETALFKASFLSSGNLFWLDCIFSNPKGTLLCPILNLNSFFLLKNVFPNQRTLFPTCR